MTEQERNHRAAEIEMILLDFDGVMTDGRVYLNAQNVEMKSFFIRDGFGIILAQRAGIEFGIITGLKSPIVDERAINLGIEEIHQGFDDKFVVFREILSRKGLQAKQTAYMGDDLFDLPVLRQVGFAAAPADAHEDVLREAHWVSRFPGGAGAVREMIELIVKARGQWDDMMREFVKA